MVRKMRVWNARTLQHYCETCRAPWEMTVGKTRRSGTKKGVKNKQEKTERPKKGNGKEMGENREPENRTRPRTVSRLYHHGMDHLSTWATSRYTKEGRKEKRITKAKLTPLAVGEMMTVSKYLVIMIMKYRTKRVALCQYELPVACTHRAGPGVGTYIFLGGISGQS